MLNSPAGRTWPKMLKLVDSVRFLYLQRSPDVGSIYILHGYRNYLTTKSIISNWLGYCWKRMGRTESLKSIEFWISDTDDITQFEYPDQAKCRCLGEMVPLPSLLFSKKHDGHLRSEDNGWNLFTNWRWSPISRNTQGSLNNFRVEESLEVLNVTETYGKAMYV